MMGDWAGQWSREQIAKQDHYSLWEGREKQEPNEGHLGPYGQDEGGLWRRNRFNWGLKEGDWSSIEEPKDNLFK